MESSSQGGVSSASAVDVPQVQRWEFFRRLSPNVGRYEVSMPDKIDCEHTSSQTTTLLGGSGGLSK